MLSIKVHRACLLDILDSYVIWNIYWNNITYSNSGYFTMFVELIIIGGTNTIDAAIM